MPGIMANARNLSTQKAETGELQQVQSQSGLHSEFQLALATEWAPVPLNTKQKHQKYCFLFDFFIKGLISFTLMKGSCFISSIWK